ncbi:hypothetical protein JO83_07995 [Avibacterium paragallinarum]|nr:hypothetical protein JO83_07995 [Avibacterium paragallinarum]
MNGCQNGGFFYSQNLANLSFPRNCGKAKNNLFNKFVKKLNDELGGSPKGRRNPQRAVRPILPSSSPMIGLCGDEFLKLIL